MARPLLVVVACHYYAHGSGTSNDSGDGMSIVSKDGMSLSVVNGQLPVYLLELGCTIIISIFPSIYISCIVVL